MEPAVGPRLLESFLTFRLKYLDKPTKAALRLCSKQFKAIVNASVLSVEVAPDDLFELLDCNWSNLEILDIEQKAGQENSAPSPRVFKALLFAVNLKFPSLSTLYLHNCTTLATLPANIAQLSHLQQLSIESTVFEAFPPSFGQLTALESLVIQNCGALTIGGFAPIAKLKHLKHLNIIGKPADDPAFPNWILDNITTSIEDLRLSDLKSLPPAIGKFKHLTSLYLDDINITEVPDFIGSLTALRQLWLYGPNRPVTLPSSISSLTALEKLCLTSKMDDIGLLQHLTRLKLLDFEIPEDETLPYPDFLWNMTSLTTLQLCHYSLDGLPPEIANLKQLQFFQLDMNQLQDIPSSIGDLSALTELRMWNIPSLTLPESLGNLSRLEVLSFKFCSSLQTLPESIGNCQNLKHLEIIDCRSFSSLPSSIGNLKSLEYLYVVRAHITELPETIGRLGALEELRVNDCSSFTTIPDSFADLIWGKTITYRDWRLKLVNFKDCPNLSFSPKIKLVLDFMEHHGVYQKDIEEYYGLEWEVGGWNSSY